MRIVSLLPSATEMLLAITGRVDHPGAALVGRSHECDFPASASLAGLPALTVARTKFESSAQVDGEVRSALAAGESLYTLDEERLRTLKPDLILTQDLCEVCSIDLGTVRRVAGELRRADGSPVGVLSFDPWTIEGVFDDVLRLGREIGMEAEALRAVVGWRERMDRAADLVAPFAAKPVTVFLEWTDPLFVGGHWTPQLIERAGGEHPLNPTVADEAAGAAEGAVGVTQRRAGKSIAVPSAAIAAVRPEFVFVAPCGLSLEQAVRETELLVQRCRERGETWWDELPAVRAAVRTAERANTETRGTGPGVYCIDGNQFFNRPGPRLVDAFEFLAAVLNDRPERVPEGFPCVGWIPSP